MRLVRKKPHGQSSKHSAGRQQIGQVGFTLLIRHATSRIFKHLPGNGPEATRAQGIRMGLFGAGVERICAVVAAASAREAAAQLRRALRETPTVELRLDWLKSDSERRRFLAWLHRKRPRGAVLLATCRRRAGGGLLAGGVQEELSWLAQAGEAGCLWCDLEVETLRRLPRNSIREYSLPRRILLSLHDFRRMPPLDPALGVRWRGQVDAIKVAGAARTIADSTRLLRFAAKVRNCVAVPMGEVGFPARLLSLREGSALAYAPVSAATAPWPVSLPEMKHPHPAHPLHPQTAVVLLRVGRSSRACAFALARAGGAVGQCARGKGAGRELARAGGAEVVSRRALETEFFDAILNTTPVGMHPDTAISPLEPGELHCRIVMDLIYRPERTRLLKLAAQKRIATVSGVEMFLAQGIAQWELWMKRRAPERAMRRAVLSALREEERARSSR